MGSASTPLLRFTKCTLPLCSAGRDVVVAFDVAVSRCNPSSSCVPCVILLVAFNHTKTVVGCIIITPIRSCKYWPKCAPIDNKLQYAIRKLRYSLRLQTNTPQYPSLLMLPTKGAAFGWWRREVIAGLVSFHMPFGAVPVVPA